MILSNFPEYHSTSLEETVEKVWTLSAGRVTKTQIGQAGICSANAVALPEMSMMVATSSWPMMIEFEPFPRFRRLFRITNVARLEVQGSVETEVPSCSGITVPANTRWTVNHNANWSVVSLRAEERALLRTVQHLSGVYGDKPLVFDHAEGDESFGGRLLEQAVMQTSMELNHCGNPLAQPVALALQEAMLVRLVLFSRHSYSTYLERTPRDPSPSQIRRVQDYIIAHAGDQIDTSILANVAGVSLRSLYRLFRDKTGCSPSEYMKQVRLDLARTLLGSPTDGITVTSVAYKCGFAGLGHFAAAYHERFGEYPSQTPKDNLSKRI